MPNIRKPNLQLIYVSDVKRSTEYYKDLFNFEPHFVTPRYVVFKIDGEADFAIWSGGEVPENDFPRFTEIGINLASDSEVKALYQEWKNDPKINFYKELHTDVFGETFLIKDPDGHVIRVSSAD
ncbi:VOC family protein [uncultured Microbulbifer sp.]|uniref:VOC family protein n=1 Tax=uncultured Microbulbifer sp. TaxID=348147 RepID=UPI00262B965B|nr:VOC family protein [uncultured Microbulbifer sp.]